MTASQNMETTPPNTSAAPKRIVNTVSSEIFRQRPALNLAIARRVSALFSLRNRLPACVSSWFRCQAFALLEQMKPTML